MAPLSNLDAKEALETIDAPPLPGPPRRRVARFVVTFLAITFAMLLTSRYVSSAGVMRWYLFQIARHTAWILDAVGEKAELEQWYDRAGKEKEVHAKIAEWTGAPPPPENTPVTDYTYFRYRALELDRELEAARAALKAVADTAAANGANSAGAAERERLARSVREAEARVEDAGPLITFTYAPERVFLYRIVPACGAVMLMSIYVAAVVAFPSALKAKALGLLIGLPALYMVNVLRLATLGVIGAFVGDGPIFGFAHHYVWQGIYLVFVAILLLLWIRFLVMRKAE